MGGTDGRMTTPYTAAELAAILVRCEPVGWGEFKSIIWHGDMADAGAAISRLVAELTRAREAIRELIAAIGNNGKTSSLRSWNEGMKAAVVNARAALGEEPAKERPERENLRRYIDELNSQGGS